MSKPVIRVCDSEIDRVDKRGAEQKPRLFCQGRIREPVLYAYAAAGTASGMCLTAVLIFPSARSQAISSEMVSL